MPCWCTYKEILNLGLFYLKDATCSSCMLTLYFRVAYPAALVKPPEILYGGAVLNT